MKKIVFLLFPLFCYSQSLTGIETSYLDPDKVSYPKGEKVLVCYQMEGWTGGSNCKLESLEVELGEGWENLTPLNPPQNCSITTEGNWVWIENGWHFEFGPSNNNPFDDIGDWDFFGDCIRSFCFEVQVKDSCEELDLSIIITSRGDNINSICNSYHYLLYNGYIKIGPECGIGLYIPNSFTPNGDESNNTFKASGQGINKFNLEIYNRWNEIIFESADINEGWDGNNSPVGVYSYKVLYTNVLGETHQIYGHINLIK